MPIMNSSLGLSTLLALFLAAQVRAQDMCILIRSSTLENSTLTLDLAIPT